MRSLLLSALIILIPLNSWSAPREITLFPDSAQIIETTKVKVQTEGKNLQKAMFLLPPQADPDSLVTQLSSRAKMKIEDQSLRQIIRQDDVKISELKKQIEKIKNDKRSLQASIHALNIQMQFWQLQTKAKMKTLSDAHNMSTAIGKNTKKAYQDKTYHELELEKLDKQIKELQEELDQMAGKKDTSWEVTILLSGAQAAEATLTYSYSMSGCGWLPLYRLEASPKDGKVSFTWEAEIWQSSGQDWSQVITNLATLKPPPSVSPSDLPPWIIKPRPVFRYKQEMKSAKANVREEDDESLAAPAPAGAVPRQVRQSTYSVWQIGKKNLPAGSRQRVKLQEETWPAGFSYLIRPSLSPQAFVRASILLPESKEVPAGDAIFMVDGAIIGKRQFALAGKETTLFFGTDRLVTAKKTLLSKKSGEKGLLTDRQTFAWDWRIEIINSREVAARVMIEEPNPQSEDERIRLTFKHDPEPSEKTPSLLIWNLDVAAGKNRSILSSVRLEAPGDMNLDLGWQR
jgi:uncharacterized protein (TIGR02231 family)